MIMLPKHFIRRHTFGGRQFFKTGRRDEVKDITGNSIKDGTNGAAKLQEKSENGTDKASRRPVQDGVLNKGFETDIVFDYK